MGGYVPPKLNESGFACPHCGVLAHQTWAEAWRNVEGAVSALEPPTRYRVAQCFRCKDYSFWRVETMIYPLAATAPLPNPDLPDDIKADYEEARTIAALSPRGAAALLRLAIQKLCKELGERGEKINDDIASLVRKGLDPRVQQALDVVRVTGNNAVHPGQIDLNDDPERARSLFAIVNLIAEEMISKPKHVQELFDQLPEKDKQAIAKRDARTP